MKLLREPLLHFVVLGGLLFAVHASLQRGRAGAAADPQRTVHVTARELDWLKETWSRQWQRPPTTDELEGMLADYVKEELLAREARALGLDENDTIVRRRLAQKLTFLLEDSLRAAEPSDDDLTRVYEASPALWERPARLSLRQIYFSRERRGEQARNDAIQVLGDLSRAAPSADAAGSGDGSLLPAELTNLDEGAVASQFGPEFARAVFALEPGAWQGPIASAYGLHLVRVTEKTLAQRRSFAEARPQVLDEWRRVQQKEADERSFAELLKKYELVVDDSVRPLLGRLAIGRGDAP